MGYFCGNTGHVTDITDHKYSMKHKRALTLVFLIINITITPPLPSQTMNFYLSTADMMQVSSAQVQSSVS